LEQQVDVGIAYGVRSSEDELAAAKQMASNIEDKDVRLYKQMLMKVNLLFLGHSCIDTML